MRFHPQYLQNALDRLGFAQCRTDVWHPYAFGPSRITQAMSSEEISASALHDRVLQRLEQPLPWDKRMASWSSESAFEHTVRANDQGYYLYLHALVAEVQPRVVLELGTCQGGSALCMLLALPASGWLVTCDLGGPYPPYLREVSGDPRLRLVLGNSCDPELYPKLGFGPIDLLFIDTEHTAAQVTAEWDIYRPLMAPGGVVAMDDIHMNDVGEFWDALPNDKVDTGEAYHKSGFGFFLA